MTPNRVDIARWALGIAALLTALLLLPAFGPWQPLGWLLAGSAAAAAGLVQVLGINTTPLGKVSFLPTAALMAYFVLGRETALAMTSAGLLTWSALHMLRRQEKWAHRPWPLWEAAGSGWLALAQNAVGLLAADFAFRVLGAAPPLETLTTLDDTLPIIAAVGFYLIAHNLLLILDALLRRVSIASIREHYNVLIPAAHILPAGLAPFAAIAGARMGLPAFFIFEGILITLALVIKRLVKTQDTLQQQIEQFARLSSISQTLRSNLDVNTLLLNTYLQIAALLNLKNVLIALREGNREADWRVRFISLNGHRLSNPDHYPLDDFSRWVLREKTPLYAESTAATGAELGLKPPAARAWLGLPLLAAGRAIGCMAVWLDDDQQPGRQFTESDRDLLGAIAVQTEMALQNALLYREAQQHAIQLARVNDISTVLNSSLNPEQVLRMIVSSATEVAGCDRAAIYLCGDDDACELILTEAEGFSPGFASETQADVLPLTPDQRRAVLEDGESVLVADLEKVQGSLDTGTLRMADAESFAAFACLPLTTQNGRIGLLAVFYDQPHTFAASELELLETFANQAALAVTNAQDYQQIGVQLTRRSSQIARVADVGQWLNATLDLNTICKLVVDAAVEGCGATAGLLVLSGSAEAGDAGSEMQMAAWRGFDPSSTRRAPHHVAEEIARSDSLDGQPHTVEVAVKGESAVRTQLRAPIAVDNQVLGTLVLESPDAAAFGEDDLSFVRQLTVHAAATIRNGQLYRHTQRVRDTLHATLDASSDGLLMVDPHGRIVMANARMEDFWDFARAESALPRPSTDAGTDKLRALSEGLGYEENELKHLLNEGRRSPVMPARKDMVVTQARAGHRQRYVERAIRPVYDDEEQFIGLLLVFRDVTEQQELEQARKDLTGMIVHELRSPLQAVMGSMRLISQVAPEGSAVIHQATEVSRRAVKKLLNLINNLLDLSRLEQGEFVLDPVSERIEPLLHDAVEELMPLAAEMDVEVSIDVPGGLPPACMDRDMIGRVVLNLLDNALKYSPPSTSIVVSAAARGSGPHDSMLSISVSDHGPGVPEEYRGLIFDRYTQIPGVRGRRRSAGLGLAFCKLAVESHGGSIWVDDNREGGSVFTFTLPVMHLPERIPDG